MPVLENVQVSLDEILEVRGQPLEEYELWGLLFQTTEAVQDIFLRGHACKDDIPQYLVTPSNLLCTARGKVILNECLPDSMRGTRYWCSEMEDKGFYSETHNLEKIYVFTLGQTMLYAAYYKVQDNCQRKLSPLIKTVFQAMCQSDVDLRMILSDVAQVCSLHATKYMNGFTFAKSVATLHREVLGSLPEHEILAQVDRDVMMEKEVEHSEDTNEDFSDVNYKYYAYGHRLGYYPELSKATKSSLSKNSVTPKERWQKAYSAVLKEVQRSKMSFIKKDEIFEAWKNHKAQQSIFRVYEELTERRKMLELLRLSINIEPSTPVDVDKNPLLMTGLKPKTIAELVLLLQRPSKQSAAYSKLKSEEPCSSTERSEEQFEEENYENPYYAIDKIALQKPFPLTKLDCTLKKSYPGPEFVINKLKPHTKIMPFYYNKDLKPTLTVSISLLNGESIDVECLPSVNGKQLYQAVADHLKLQERYLFGLAYAQGGEYIFIERKQRLVDVLQLSATSSTLVSADLIHLFFKVKFYVDDAHLLRTQALRHIFYLQLRKDFLEDDFYCDIDSAIILGGLALQAEFGNYDQSVYGKEYFLLEHYLSFSNILCLNRLTAKTRLRDQHISLAGISKELAELKFIQGMMKFPEYGSHYHKVLQDKKNTSSVVWLSIRSKGIAVYENVSGKRSLCQNYPWENIKRISFSKKYFCVAPKTESITSRHVVYRFYTSLLHRSQYLFNIAMAHHKFFLKLKSVSKASEIFTEDLDEEHPYDKLVEKEIGWDLCDNADKFQPRISKMARRISSLKKSSTLLKQDFIFSKSEKGLCKNNSLSSIELDIMRKKKLSSNLVTRSSSAPDPVKKSDFLSASKVLSVKDLQPRVVSSQPKSSCGKQSMKVVRLHKDPEYGLGMVITCGNTYDTILHGAFVESVYPGSPADLDGSIKPGDQIMSVNGVDVRNDHFLTVVDLIQYSNGPVDLLIGKNNDYAPDISVFSNKEITEKSFVKSKAWIVGSENTTECMSPDSKSEKNKTYIDTPIPIPRKKWVEKKESSSKSLNFDAPDLTINHSTNFSNNESRNQDSDSIDLNGHFNSKNCNIPDIIASQIKHGFETSPSSRDECLDSEESCPIVATLDANDFLPGEVYHVVLDKKGGSSLGLYIYQDLESTCSQQGDIYIHSIIPNSPAELDGRIRPGDRILEMNGVLLENLSYQEIVTKIRESPQVVHLVLEKGKPIETKCSRNEIHQKEIDSITSDLAEHSSAKDFSSVKANKTQENSKNNYIIPTPFELSNELVSNSADNSFSSLPTSTASPTPYSAKERNSAPSSYQHNSSNKNAGSEGISSLSSAHSDGGFSSKLNSAKDFSSHPHAKVRNQSNDGCRTPKANPNSLTSYKSTPNLADNSDEEENINKSHYLNKSYDCLLSPLFMHPHQALIDFYQNYSYIRGSSSNIHQIPAVPIRKKKLKKIEDIYNYSNSENTFYVSIRKSSRGLGLSILGGRDACKNDPFSQLIRIRKLYPLQPALECGKLAIGDVILEVNGTNMIGLTNTEALEVLRSAPMDVVLKVFRPSKSLIPSFSTYKGAIWPLFDSSSSSASSSLSHRETNSYNVETGEFEVTLIKRGGSLGFTISKKEISGENPTEGIYVKALVREPAVSDGRIQPGDQILEVNGTTISSMSHSEAISFLRNTPSTVTLKLYRGETIATSGGLEDYHISKPLRWEALELLNDRVKHKDHEEYNTLKKKIKKKLANVSNAPSNSSTESGSTSSSSGQEHVIDESLETSISEDLALEGIGLQRNQRPKSLDVLNSSDRKHCSGFTEEDVFHRQSSVMCPNVEQKVKSESSQNESPTKKGGKNLLKWRGSTLPDSEDSNSLTGHEIFNISSQSSCTADTSNPVELSSDDEKPVPYPRTTSYKSEWVNSFEVCLDRGWHGRLGFSLFDPPPVETDSPRNLLPISAEVKAVYPGSLADKDGRIKVGDRIVEVNKECLLNKSATEVIDILRKTRGVTKMIFCRLEKRS